MLLAVGGDRHAVVGIIPSEMIKSCPGHFVPEEDAQEVVEDFWDKRTGNVRAAQDVAVYRASFCVSSAAFFPTVKCPEIYG